MSGIKRCDIDWDSLPLGKVPDHSLADSLCVSRWIVRSERIKRGLPPSDTSRQIKGILWDAVALGKVSDTDIARELGVAVPVVRLARTRRGIPPFERPSIGVDWDSLPLGKTSDIAIARTLGEGVAPWTVGRHRKSRGIAPFKYKFLTSEMEGANYPEAMIDLYWHQHGIPHQFQPKIGRFVPDWAIQGDTLVEYAGLSVSPRWGAEYTKRLMEKCEFYRQSGWKVLVIYPRDLPKYDTGLKPVAAFGYTTQGILWETQPLGRVPDLEIAHNLSVPCHVVVRARKKLGIPVAPRRERDWSDVPLGTDYDHVIASHLGVSSNTVQRARIQKGIPSWRETCQQT